MCSGLHPGPDLSCLSNFPHQHIWKHKRALCVHGELVFLTLAFHSKYTVLLSLAVDTCIRTALLCLSDASDMRCITYMIIIIFFLLFAGVKELAGLQCLDKTETGRAQTEPVSSATSSSEHCDVGLETHCPLVVPSAHGCCTDPCFSWALLLQYMWSCHPFLAHRHFFKFCFALWFLFVHQCLVSCSSLLTEERSPVPCVQSVCCVVGKPLSAAFGFWFFGVGRTF